MNDWSIAWLNGRRTVTSLHNFENPFHLDRTYRLRGCNCIHSIESEYADLYLSLKLYNKTNNNTNSMV
jgi:hypothetical protein